MNTIKFYKYQATGNDFILIDNRKALLKFSNAQISQLCDRKFGIGADGLILIEEHSEAAFEMVYYNPDGSQSLCGNGSRCAVSFAGHLGIIDKNTDFLAYDGMHNAQILDHNQVRLKMSDVQNVRLLADGMFIDTGSPHLVKYVVNLDNYHVYEEGKAIRNGGLYKEAGVNVNFVEVTGKSEIFARTYERGVENETLSCGTGVTAAALSSMHKGLDSPVTVKTLGGILTVEFQANADGSFSEVFLTGPAKMVFEGMIEMPGH